MRCLGIDLNFIKKWKFDYFFLQCSSLKSGSCFQDDCNSLAWLIRDSAYQKHMLLCYHFFCFLCESVPLRQVLKPSVLGNRRDLWKSSAGPWPEPWPQQPSQSTSEQGQTGNLTTFLPERGPDGWIQEPCCVDRWKITLETSRASYALCASQQLAWSPVEDSQFRTFLPGSYCSIKGCNTVIEASEQNTA